MGRGLRVIVAPPTRNEYLVRASEKLPGVSFANGFANGSETVPFAGPVRKGQVGSVPYAQGPGVELTGLQPGSLGLHDKALR